MTDDSTSMTRRTALLTTATAAATLAGCMGGESPTESVTHSPYDPDTELELPADVISAWFDDRQVEDAGNENENFAFEFTEPDADIFVMIEPEIHGSEDSAQSYFESQSQKYSTSEIDIDDADQAWWADEGDHARVLVRDHNLVFVSVGARRSGLAGSTADQNRAIDYATAALEYWHEEHRED